MYTFVTGGLRSGRSNYALRRASELGPPPWLYIATAVETEDIKKRIERHRRDDEAIWRTAPVPAKLSELVDPKGLAGVGALVFDGVAGWLETRLGSATKDSDSIILDEIAAFADSLYRLSVPAVVVSTEMSMGIVPVDAGLARLVKVTASANQILGQQAGAMVMMVSGVPLRIR